MRILFITTLDPDSESNGASIYTKSLLKLLNGVTDFEVTLISCQPKAYTRLQKVTRLMRLVITSQLSDKPMKYYYFRNNQADAHIQEIAGSNQYDLVIYDHLETLWAKKFFRKIPSLLVMQNLEYELQMERIKSSQSFLLKALLWHDTRKLNIFETHAFNTSSAVVFISAADHSGAEEQIRGIGCVVPPIFDYPRLTESNPLPSAFLKLAYIGDFRWWPNVQNFNWLCQQVLPLAVDANLPQHMQIYGKGSENMSGEHMTGNGFVPDIRTAWQNCDLLLAPTQFGGGLNVKIAEALYNGVPVLTTRKAAAAFAPHVAKSLEVADSPAEWLVALQRLSIPSELQAAKAKARAQSEAFSPLVNAANIEQLVRSITACCAASSATVPAH